MTTDPLACSSEGCAREPAEALRIVGYPGHVHDCPGHAADLRTHAIVSEASPIAGGACPWPCTANPIGEATPPFGDWQVRS